MSNSKRDSLPLEIGLESLKLTSHLIRSFSAGLIKIVHPSQKQEAAIPIGSGTFVSIRDIHGILTAHHVSKELKPGCSLGLSLDSKEHTYAIDLQLLQIINFFEGIDNPEGEGPDLSFIMLQTHNVSGIKPYKSFYNLSVARDETISKLHNSIWFICGTPEERTTKGVSKRGPHQTFSFSMECGGVSVGREYANGDYDYIEANVQYDKRLDVPLAFNGVSGGGLWQVPISKSADGILILGSPILSGVAFYQSEVQEGKRFIKCHGRNSLKTVHDKVSEKCS